MSILTPKNEKFDYKICEKLYNKISKFMGNECKFNDLIENTHFYSFYDSDKFAGCIYIVYEDEKLFLNGFSIRKNHKFNIAAVKKVLTFYNCDIYSKTKNKTAQFLLKKCGFELINIDSDGIKYYKKEKLNGNKK